MGQSWLTLTTRTGALTSPDPSRGPITDSTAPTPSSVQNGREPSTPSRSAISLLRAQTVVSRLVRSAVSTMSSGPRLLAEVDSGS